MNRAVKVGLYGVGVVSSIIAKALVKKKGVEIISAIDIDKSKIGKDLGDILDLPSKLDVEIVQDVAKAFSERKPDIVVHATSSNLRQVSSQIATCIREGVNVVSTCEELAYPYMKNKDIADELDTLAKQYQVTILGTGINPGFLMDALPIMMTGPCLEVNRITVTRMMNSGKRRIPYQKKVGTDLTVDEFREKIDGGEITGHVGLDISIAMIAESLGWKLDKIVELPTQPVIAEKTMKTSYTTIKRGRVAGLKSRAYGIRDGEKIIDLYFISHASVEEEYDAIEIEGEPKIKVKILGGVHGDIGTTAMIINAIPKVINAPPGLYTMKDLPIPSATPSDLNRYVKNDI